MQYVSRHSGGNPGQSVKVKWPFWAEALRPLSNSEDKGIGDVVARVIGEEATTAFEAWHIKTFGRACKCKVRRAIWNRMYPLNH